MSKALERVDRQPVKAIPQSLPPSAMVHSEAYTFLKSWDDIGNNKRRRRHRRLAAVAESTPCDRQSQVLFAGQNSGSQSN